MPSHSAQGESWKPAVPRGVLTLIAGIAWIVAATFLNVVSYTWLKTEKPGSALLAGSLGFVCALIIHHFGFLRVVDKNIARIRAMEGRRCAFSFMSWRSYILVMIMITVGYVLRHSPVPKWYLAILYIAIGSALVLSSIRYLRYALSIMRCGR